MEIRSNKGILLTLLTVVLLVLMLAELITYVYLTVDYNTVSSLGTVSSNRYTLASIISSSMVSFLHLSLYSALNALALYENPATRKGSYFVNNTGYALQSLMGNGMIYGTNEITAMGGATLANYTNAIISQGRAQGLNVIITNSSLQVYQSGYSSINATFTALAVINSSSGPFTYPITATAGILLNGSPDMYSVENNNNYNIRFEGYPSAVLVGNAYATSGSRSPFQFAYGTAVVESGAGSCGAISSKFENVNYILVVPTDTAGSCGFGGVVSYGGYGGTYSVPYLVYSSGSSIMNSINNGTSLLLDGQGLSLLNISSLQSALHNGYYFGSPFTPSYLDWAQSNLSRRSQAGLFSFNMYNRLVPVFSPLLSTSISSNVIAGPSSTQISISLWFNSRNYISSYPGTALVQEGQVSTSGNVFELAFKNSKLLFGSQAGACGSISSITLNSIVLPNTWHNVVVTFNSYSTDFIYLDGVQVGSGSFALCNMKNSAFVIGAGGGSSFNGSISNIQTYNTTFNSFQEAQIYYRGLDGIALSARNLTGWWPLNGNANDYSGRGFSGNALSNPTNQMTYRPLYNYIGDPVYDGSLYAANLTNLIEGASNCANLSQCSNGTLQHLSLGPTSLSAISGVAKTEANALGLANAVIPNIGSFNGNGYVLGQVSPYYANNNQFSVSAWAYLNSSTNGPLFDIVGCAVPPGACGSTPAISLSKNTIYVTLSGLAAITYTVPGINGWHHIALTYTPSGTDNLYVDGASVGTGGGSYSGTGIAADYWTTGCGTSCTLPGGVANTLYGKIGDIQFYKVQLTGAQVSQLYLNDSVIGVNADNRWPLSTGYNGLMNTSINTANSLDPALLANNQGICSNANVINYICGATYSQP